MCLLILAFQDCKLNNTLNYAQLSHINVSLQLGMAAGRYLFIGQSVLKSHKSATIIVDHYLVFRVPSDKQLQEKKGIIIINTKSFNQKQIRVKTSQFILLQFLKFQYITFLLFTLQDGKFKFLESNRNKAALPLFF